MLARLTLIIFKDENMKSIDDLIKEQLESFTLKTTMLLAVNSIDWASIPIDAPVYVSSSIGDFSTRKSTLAHFAGMNEQIFLTWQNGRTSVSCSTYDNPDQCVSGSSLCLPKDKYESIVSRS